jgi:bifunctional enzyme CysN/CysC
MTDNLHSTLALVSPAHRAQQKNQQPRVIWFTGYSGAGKSTLAQLLDAELTRQGRHCLFLDADALRQGLNKGLGFSAEDRTENLRRVGEVCALMLDAGLIVIAAFISPLKMDRAALRARMPPGQFFEVHVDTPLAVCEQRDVKGLYAKARAGKIPQFTGIDAPYEAPEQPECLLRPEHETPAQTLAILLAALAAKP